MTTKDRKRGVRAGARRALVVLLAALPLAACDTNNLLKVAAPTLLPQDRLMVPAQAKLMVNSAIAAYECAYASYSLVEGIISDEFADAQLGAAAWDYDRRSANEYPGGPYGTYSCTDNQTPGVYVPASSARWQADNILASLQGWKPADVGASVYDSLVATSALYAGLSYSMLAMAMCNAAVDLGPSMTQAQLLAKAEERFSTAISTAGSKPNLVAVLNAAYVGRARVRLFQGNKSGADADAKLVPAGFRFDATYSDANNRRYNRIYASNLKYVYYTVEPASRSLTVEGIPDPRVPVYNTGINGADHSVIWGQKKWTSTSDPIRVASYDEAQLIMAEAEGGTAAITIINRLRDAWSIPHYSGATDAASIQKLIISERRAVLWGEGFRNYDYQRFNLPFDYAPVGASYKAGGQYGNTTCLPLPDVERFNNPNIGS